jgi:hypothetical protein
MYNKPGKEKLNTVIPFNMLNCVPGFMWGNRINIFLYTYIKSVIEDKKEGNCVWNLIL